MLKELHIENLAVIENATITLGSRLNVFTGETGAGKSILIGGINAVLGQRVSRDIVRNGAEKAYVSAVFDGVPKSGAAALKLQEMGIDWEDELIISREIHADGRGTARVNSRAVSVTALRELGNYLINIHGQHDSQVLLDPAQHLGILDNFARHDELLLDYQTSFRELQATAREIQKLKQSARETERRAAYLQSIVDDIAPLNLEPGEDEAVEERFRIVDNAVELSRAVRAAMQYLTGDDDSGGASSLAASAYTELMGNEELLPELKPLCERLGTVGIELGDISNELSRLADSLDIDSGEYARLSARRDDLARVKRRYGPTLSDVIELYEKSATELELFGSTDTEIEILQKRKNELLSVVSKKAENLHKMRLEAAERFKNEVEEDLRFLNMPDVQLEARIESGKLTHSGMDTLEFLISANRGENAKPLAKIASGGELSRIMLALKSVLADRDDIPTLIFDEIDAGVSGRAAQKIGVKLREIAENRQVICVTHLAQLAIMGDDHILIEKQQMGARTVTEIKPLDFEGRKLEIARILGGDSITETVLRDAEEQLRSARREE